MKTVLTLITIIWVACGLSAQTVDLANEYYKKGEYEKAAEIYEKLSKSKNEARLIYENYTSTLVKLKEFDKAEKFVNQQIKANPTNLVFKADLAHIYEQAGDIEQANSTYEELLNEAASKDAYVYQIQNILYKDNKIDLLIDLYLKARAFSKSDDKYNIQLARAYLYAGKKKEMLEEVFSYGIKNPGSNYTERTIQDNIKEDEEILMLERLLYTKIQENPEETYYNDILIWHFIQQKEFSKAFTQARAIDRRLNQGGAKIYELATLAYQNGQYRDATRMFSYVLTEYPNGEFYPYARRWKIQSSEMMVRNTFPINKEEIQDLIGQYNSLLEDLGTTPKTIDALRNTALLYAFYLNDHGKAIEILNQAVALSGSNQLFKDQCKLDLGDIYILKDEPWEATLVFMQVEKSQKENTLGEIAKLKNAKLYYYTGEFELAKEVLDILKKATTREIANDAMQLSLLIQDNLGLDTTDAALRAYADVELLLFQNRNEEALNDLDSLFSAYKTHSLADEILWLRANTKYRLQDVEGAVLDLENMLSNYKYDILADDALFMLAKIYDEKLDKTDKAMELYRSLLQDFPGSIFGADARKRFRELRGDFLF